MPIKHAIWKVTKQPEPLREVALASERQLEDMIVARPAILSEDWMLIGRQEITNSAGGSTYWRSRQTRQSCS